MSSITFCSDVNLQGLATLNAHFGLTDSPCFVHVAANANYCSMIDSCIVSLIGETNMLRSLQTCQYDSPWQELLLYAYSLDFRHAVSRTTWTGLLDTILGLLLSFAACLAMFNVLAARLCRQAYPQSCCPRNCYCILSALFSQRLFRRFKYRSKTRRAMCPSSVSRVQSSESAKIGGYSAEIPCVTCIRAMAVLTTSI
jgi:hypothetical protein